jgi:hypothetical protein
MGARPARPAKIISNTAQAGFPEPSISSMGEEAHWHWTYELALPRLGVSATGWLRSAAQGASVIHVKGES